MEATHNRAIIYGAGNNCIYSMYEISRRFVIVGVADGSEEKQGSDLFGFRIGKVTDFSREQYDFVIVTPSFSETIVQKLLDSGIDEDKILYLEDALDDSTTDQSLHIAIIFYGGLGDYIIGKNWLYHLNEYVDLSQARIDAYFSEGALENAQAVFSDSDLIREIYPVDTTNPDLVSGDYQLVMSFSIFPMVRYMDPQSLFIRSHKLYEYVCDLWKFGAEHYVRGFFASPDFYKTVSSLFRAFPGMKYHALYDVLKNLNEPEEYHCSYPINIDENSYLEDLGLEKGKYITVNTGANAEYLRKPSTRTWQYSNWISLISILRERIPDDYKIVRMGLATSESVETEADIDLCGRTSVEQAKVLLKNARLHIDYEGGLVHLRHVLDGGASVVLHGPTSIERYGYQENIPIRSVECPKACEWSCRDWLVICHNNEKPNACMQTISAEDIAKCVLSELENI